MTNVESGKEVALACSQWSKYTHRLEADTTAAAEANGTELQYSRNADFGWANRLPIGKIELLR